MGELAAVLSLPWPSMAGDSPSPAGPEECVSETKRRVWYCAFTMASTGLQVVRGTDRLGAGLSARMRMDEIDPTNGIFGNHDLIRIAVARDHKQATPPTGVLLEAAPPTWGCRFRVSVIDQTAAGTAAA